MTDSKYTEMALRTLSQKDTDVVGHMIIGLSTESNELLDNYKKHRFYGRDLDIRNIKEEIGDLYWYLALLCRQIGYSLDQAKVDNIEKLAKRYPDEFVDVIYRDVDTELEHIEDVGC